MCDFDVIGAPSILSVIRKAAALAKMLDPRFELWGNEAADRRRRLFFFSKNERNLSCASWEDEKQGKRGIGGCGRLSLGLWLRFTHQNLV